MTTKFKHTWPQRETNSSKQNIAKIKNIKDQNWSCENKRFQQEKQSRQTFHNYCISTITVCVCEASGGVCFFFLFGITMRRPKKCPRALSVWRLYKAT